MLFKKSTSKSNVEFLESKDKTFNKKYCCKLTLKFLQDGNKIIYKEKLFSPSDTSSKKKFDDHETFDNAVNFCLLAHKEGGFIFDEGGDGDNSKITIPFENLLSASYEFIKE